MGYAPSIRRAAAEAGLTPSEYLAQQSAARGAGVAAGGNTGGGQVGQQSPGTGGRIQAGLTSVAPVYDPISGDWYYVRAESIDGQQRLAGSLSGQAAYQPGYSPILALDDMNVDYVPVLGANGYSLNQQEVRQDQPVLAGTTMETNFPGGNRPAGIVRPPPRETPTYDTPTPAAHAFKKPGTAKARFRRRLNTGGLQAGARGATTTPQLSLGGFNPNPLSITPQR